VTLRDTPTFPAGRRRGVEHVDCDQLGGVGHAQPTTPVNSLPPEPEVDEDGKGGLAEDAEDDWQMIQRLVKDALRA